MLTTHFKERYENARLKNFSLHEPAFVPNDWVHVKKSLDTGWASSASKSVLSFEGELAKRIGPKYGLDVINGTAGVGLALRVPSVSVGDRQKGPLRDPRLAVKSFHDRRGCP